ncbi:exocyst complex component 8 [Episyrphus balteatus]|uniref:exocyst complex component 8 n=1 Tax=Episyrphus balteatus TaxID=286459 RepID=UPI00248509BD|nr:exocyst complex component 8 [Episyrphus balteatus]
MTESTLREFDKKEFIVDKYVNSLVRESVGASELQSRKAKIQAYSDKTSSTLKKHVYANYMQFINTAKEISHLESEMYQLSHILLAQRNILGSLIEGSAAKSSGKEPVALNEDNEDVQSQQAARAIKEIVQGFKGDLEGKVFLHEGALIELDSNDYRPIQRVFFFLFNDILIVCKVKHDRRLEFVTQYDPRKVAVINIKDLEGVKNAINIITPDGSKIIQCVTLAGKNEWIEKFEAAFKFNPNNKQHKKGPAPQPPKLQKQSSSLSTKSSESKLSPNENINTIEENWGPDWLSSAPDEIEAFIVQRHFEDALGLLQKSEEHIRKDATFWNAAEISAKIKNLRTNLVNVLLQDLSNCQNRSLPLALLLSGKPLKLLVEMRRERQACATLLRVSTVTIRASQRETRRGNQDISQIFFRDMAHVVTEFLKAFGEQSACVSSLIVWCNAELQYFAGQLIKHYLIKGVLLETVAKIVESIREPCSILTEIGLDLSYHVEGLLRNTLDQIIEDSRIRLLETIGRTEDAWTPHNLQNKPNVKKFLRDMDKLGINMKSQITGDTFVNLTQSTVNFCRHFLSLTESCGILAKNETLRLSVEMLLRDLFIGQHAVKPAPDVTVDPNFVIKNKNYLVENLLVTAFDRYEKYSGVKSEILIEVYHQLGTMPKPKPRNIYQTGVI